MRKFAPLDLSFIANVGSPERESIRNVAAMINANAGWSNEDFIAEYKKVQEAAMKAARHKSTFLGGLFDLLQTPLYGIANAQDEALAGHQSDNNDSVLEDIGKTVGGVFTGLPKGLGAGLRGATQMLDGLPGLDISDEWQLDPTDKTHFSDVAIRKTTGMSSKDAAKPENWEKIKPKLQEAKGRGFWDKSVYEMLLPDVNDPDAQKEFLRRYQMLGIVNDIGADPLNWVGVGLLNKGKAAGEIGAVAQGVDAARSNAVTSEAILNGLTAPVKANKVPKFDLPVKGQAVPEIQLPSPTFTVTTGGKVRGTQSLKLNTPTIDGITQDAWDAAKRLHQRNGIPDWMFHTLLPQKFGIKPNHVDEILTHLKNGTEPTAFVAAPKVTPGAISGQPIVEGIAGSTLGKGFKGSASLGRREKTPVSGLEIPEATQVNLVKEISTLAARGEKGWLYKAADMLRKAGGKVEWVRTSEFLQRADAMAKSKGIRHNPTAMAGVLKAHIAEDVQAARKVTPSERILNTAAPEEILATGAPAIKPKLRPYQAQLANEVITKFKDELLGAKMAPGTGQALRIAQQAKVNARWSGPQQVRMWNQLTTKLKHLPPKVRYQVAAKILQHVEDFFLSKGIVPYSAAKIKDSVEGLRLSQIAMALGPKTLADNPNLLTRILAGDEKALKSLTPDQLQTIENLKAAEAVASAPAAQEGIAFAKQLANTIMKQPWSAAKRKEMLGRAANAGAEMAVQKGAGPVAAKTTQQYLNKLLSDPTGIDGVFKAARFDTEGFLRRSGSLGTKFNPVDKAFTKSVTNAISKAASLPPPQTLGGIAGTGARVKDWLGARFNAAYGVTDMRPIFLRNQASALSTSARRAQYINAIARNFPPSDVDLWHEAFRAAQADGISTGKVADLQKEISKVMENLFGGTGLKAGAIADSTVAGRSRLYMAELNAQLRRFGLGEYQFKAGKKVKDKFDNVHDFSKGADWLKSWEIWDVKKPYEFLHAVQSAVEHTVREKAMFDEIATRFGSPAKLGNVKYGVNHPRLKGYYFNEEGARQAEQFVKILDEVNTPSSKGLQHLDHVISKLKASLTIYIPSHHWTNIIGDVFFNWFAGVNDVRRYKQAVNVMTSQRGRYGDIAEFKNMTGPEAFKQAVARGMIGTETLTAAGLKVSPAGNAVVVTMKNGQKVTADMIYTAAMREGILPSARVLEEVTSEVTSVLDKFRPLGGQGQRAVHVVSEVRDHIPRLAQFIDGIAKHNGSLASAVEKSAANVRKWHPDGLDLTRFERTVMKRVFPFYSWTRKAIPLAIESAIVNGNKVMAYPRLMEEIALANGIDAAPGEQFPDDQLFPEWMRERGIGPVLGGPGSYGVVNPSTPVLDIATMLGHPGQATLDMLNPMARVPLELSQGATLGKQVPIENEAGYLAMQVPGLSQAGRVSGAYGVSDSVANSDEQKMLNLINLLTGAKATQSGIYQKSAQFDLRDYLRSQRER